MRYFLKNIFIGIFLPQKLINKYPMQELKATIPLNPYFWTPDGVTVLTACFSSIKNEITYIKLLLKYPVPSYDDVDLFQFIDNESLDRLRNHKTILVFDSIFEGFSPTVTPIAKALYRSCVIHNINPKKIFFFTGNLIDELVEINNIPIFILDSCTWKDIPSGGLKTAKLACYKNYEKAILSLSRRNRSHRVVAHCMLFNSPLFEHSIISQDVFDYTIHNHSLEKMEVTDLQYENFKNILPLIADENQFDVNDPFNALPELHSKTAFSIVNETLADNSNNTTLFFSEKFLKPIINFQPMLIYGHQGINKKLSLLGFKNYESYFNLDFDDEPDDILRYKKLLESAAEAVNKLKSLSREEQIEWRFSNRKLLTYNYEVFVENKHRKEQISKFEKLLTDIFSSE
jgi:hypothetical protein